MKEHFSIIRVLKVLTVIFFVLIVIWFSLKMRASLIMQGKINKLQGKTRQAELTLMVRETESRVRPAPIKTEPPKGPFLGPTYCWKICPTCTHPVIFLQHGAYMRDLPRILRWKRGFGFTDHIAYISAREVFEMKPFGATGIKRVELDNMFVQVYPKECDFCFMALRAGSGKICFEYSFQTAKGYEEIKDCIRISASAANISCSLEVLSEMVSEKGPVFKVNVVNKSAKAQKFYVAFWKKEDAQEPYLACGDAYNYAPTMIMIKSLKDGSSFLMRNIPFDVNIQEESITIAPQGEWSSQAPFDWYYQCDSLSGGEYEAWAMIATEDSTIASDPVRFVVEKKN